jgi:hypothetical protein
VFRFSLLLVLALCGCDPTVTDWTLKEGTGLFTRLHKCVCHISAQDSEGRLGDLQRPFVARCATGNSAATGLKGDVEFIFRRYTPDGVAVLTQGKRTLMTPEVAYTVTDEGHGARSTMTADTELTHQLPDKNGTYFGIIMHAAFMPAWTACDDTNTCTQLPESHLTDFRIACSADFIGGI